MGKRTGVIAAGVALMLTSGIAGCAQVPPSGASTGATTRAVPSPASTPTKSVTPTVTPTTPSATPTAAGVKATGALSFHKGNLVSKALVGECVVDSGKPTVTLADDKNDFYGTVELTIVFDADVAGVASIAADFGEDSELITRKMAYPAKGASATLTESGGVYRVSGNAMLYEDGATTGSLIPYTVTARCASTDWLD